jgi:multidrug efflux system outer membrane protein
VKLLTRILGSSSILLLVAGCKVGPNYKRPVGATAADYRGAMAPDIASGVAATPLGAQKWDAVFTDPVLKELIRDALKNNYDVKIAADHVLEQQAQVGMTRAAQFPTLSGGATQIALGLPTSIVDKANSGGTNGSGGSTTSIADKYYSGGYNLSVAYNLDFWGMYRRQTEGARAQLRATEWAQQVTYSSLVENVASSYYQLRSLDALLAIATNTAAARLKSFQLTKKLADGGSTSLADVRQAQELLYTAEAQIPDLERQVEQQENNLSLLLGHAPAPILRGIAVADAPHPPGIPVGLPSELLERRPDIRRVEELLVQANANIGVARAQFFPQLSLSGTGGVSSNQLKGLVDSGNGFFYVAGALSQPIFDGGKIRSNYRLAKATNKEMLDTYQQTIMGALRDVSNSLVAYRKARTYRDKQELQTSAAADAVRLAKMRYNAGSTSFLEVLTNDANLYASQQNLETARLQEALSLVQLYNALGGGW